MGNALLQVKELRLAIPDRAPGKPVSFAIEPGQCWGLLGPNGVGKTTLLHTLAGLRAPFSGAIDLAGRRLAETRRRRAAQQIGLVLQQHQDGFPATVLETALMGRHPYLRPWQWESADDRARAHQALTRMDLAELTHREVQTLSGGERQRLALATLLTQDPPLWLLDEPTSHLDLRHQVAVLNLIQQETQNHGKAVVMALHDVNQAVSTCSHLILLYSDGNVCCGTTPALARLDLLEKLLGVGLRMLKYPHGTWICPLPSEQGKSSCYNPGPDPVQASHTHDAAR